MEMTYLYGVLRSEEFPPLNPWFAGGFINYYYFGFVLCGGLIKALGVLPEVGFNLCLATFYGLTAAGAFGAARALTPTRALWPAWAATAFVAVFGNLFQIRFIWNRFVLLGTPDHEFSFPIFSDIVRAGFGAKRYFSGQSLSPYIADLYWVSARAIGEGGPGAVQPITEFPYWSFLYADLHPHVIALPFTLAIVTLLGGLGEDDRRAGQGRAHPAVGLHARIFLADQFVGLADLRGADRADAVSLPPGVAKSAGQSADFCAR